MATDPSNWQGLDLCNGRYCGLEKLGSGGMGHVYKGIDKRLSRPVVIKVPKREMLADREFVKRFRRELQSLVNLEHASIVRIYDYNVEDKVPYAVLQFLSGGDLDAHRSDKSRQINTWLPDVAAALDFVHKRKFVHRDVKPGNILFDSEDSAYLSDFGIAKVVADVEDQKNHQDITRQGFAVGTPEYMAPEIHSGNVSRQVDQYALAVTVYEMLSGTKPFRGNTPVETAIAHKTEDAPPLTKKGIPDELNQVVLKGLAKNPADRYGDCQKFAEAVVACFDPNDVTGDGPRPPGSTTVITKLPTDTVSSRVMEFAKSQPLLVAGGVFAMIVACLIFSFAGGRSSDTKGLENLYGDWEWDFRTMAKTARPSLRSQLRAAEARGEDWILVFNDDGSIIEQQIGSIAHPPARYEYSKISVDGMISKIEVVEPVTGDKSTWTIEFQNDYYTRGILKKSSSPKNRIFIIRK